MKIRTAISVLVLCHSLDVTGQETPLFAQQGRVIISPVLQSWDVEDANGFSQLTIPFFVFYPASEKLGLTLRTAQAKASGDDLTTVNSLTDTQVAMTYALPDKDIVINAGINLPTGQKELEPDEFDTSFLISNSLFDFRAPGFGQGVNIAVGVTWARALARNVSAGAGASVQVKGKYKPIVDFENYSPGNELLLTGGLDYQINTSTNASLDLIFITAGEDKLGDQTIFAAGNRIIISTQFRKTMDFDEIRLFARLRTKGKNEQIVGTELVSEEEKSTPNQLHLAGQYRIRMSDKYDLAFLAEMRTFEKTIQLLSDARLFGFGATVFWRLTEQLQSPVTFKFTKGSFGNTDLTGFEISAGVVYSY